MLFQTQRGVGYNILTSVYASISLYKLWFPLVQVIVIFTLTSHFLLTLLDTLECTVPVHVYTVWHTNMCMETHSRSSEDFKITSRLWRDLRWLLSFPVWFYQQANERTTYTWWFIDRLFMGNRLFPPSLLHSQGSCQTYYLTLSEQTPESLSWNEY